MSETIKEIAKTIAEKQDDEIAKQFALNIARILKENGIKVWMHYINNDNGIEEKDGCIVYKGTFGVAFDGIDTSEHDKQIRADERAKIKEMFKMYQRLELKFTLNQCKEKDGLYYLDATDLFNGMVDQVIDSERKHERSTRNEFGRRD